MLPLLFLFLLLLLSPPPPCSQYTEEDLDGACETLASKEEVVDEDKADLRERATKLLQRETALRWLLQNTQFDYKPIATVLEIDPSA
eukprot:jgi/Mesen1/1182/ME000127S00216